MSPFGPLGTPSLDFFDFLLPKNNIKNRWVFNIAQKRPKTTYQSTFGRPRVKFRVKKLYFLRSCLHSFSNSWENAVYQKNTAFTVFFKHLATSNHIYSKKQIHNFLCFFRPLFHSTGLKAKSYMLCSKMRFWTSNLCSPWAPKCNHWGTILTQKTSNARSPELPWTSWGRPGRPAVQK